MSLSRPDDDAKEGDFLERDILFIEHLELGSKETDRGRVLLFATQIDFHLREIF